MPTLAILDLGSNSVRMMVNRIGSVMQHGEAETAVAEMVRMSWDGR